MELRVMRHMWGVDEPWEVAFPKFSASGYSGIDALIPPETERDRFRASLDEYGFGYIAQVLTTGSTVEEHVESFRQQVESAAPLEPLRIGCHGGTDGWTEDESARFFEAVLQIEEEAGVPVGHETHRGRILYNPWVTARMLERFDELRLVCDFSHWVCVCERMLDDVEDILRQAAERCIHIHARVGYEEGPQVPDPRAPEYGYHVRAHERWWSQIWDAQAARGLEVSTVTPEYGPPNYLHTLPHTRAPVVGLAEVCDWQAGRLRELYASRVRQQ